MEAGEIQLASEKKNEPEHCLGMTYHDMNLSDYLEVPRDKIKVGENVKSRNGICISSLFHLNNKGEAILVVTWIKSFKALYKILLDRACTKEPCHGRMRKTL